MSFGKRSETRAKPAEARKHSADYIAEHRVELEEEQDELKLEMMDSEEQRYHWDEINGILEAMPTLESLMGWVDENIDSLTRYGGRMPHWIGSAIARNVDNLACRPLDPRAPMDLTQSVGAIWRTALQTGSIPTSKLPDAARTVEDVLHETLNTPSLAYLWNHLGDRPVWQVVDTGPILKGAEDIYLPTLLRDALEKTIGKSEVTAEAFLPYIVGFPLSGSDYPKTTRAIPYGNDLERACIVLEAIGDRGVQLVRNAISGLTIELSTTPLLAYKDSGTVDERFALAEREILNTIEYLRLLGKPIDVGSFVGKVILNEIHPDRCSNEVPMDLELVSRIRNRFGLERVQDPLSSFPKVIRWTFSPNPNGRNVPPTTVFERLSAVSDAFGFGWKEGEAWPISADTKTLLQSALEGFFNGGSHDTFVDAIRSFVRVFGVVESATDIGKFRPWKGLSYDGKDFSGTPNKLKQLARESIRGMLCSRDPINTWADSQKFLDFVRKFREMEALCGEPPEMLLPEPLTESMIGRLLQLSSNDARSGIDYLAGSLSDLSRTAIQSFITSLLERGQLKDAKRLLDFTKCTDLEIDIDDSTVGYWLIRKSESREIIQWLRFWDESTDASLPLDSVQRALLLADFIENDNLTNEDASGVIGLLRCVDENGLRRQRETIKRVIRDKPSRIVRLLDAILEHYKLDPAEFDSETSEAVLSVLSIDRVVGAFGEEGLLTLLAKARFFEIGPERMRELVLKHRGLLETSAARAKGTRGPSFAKTLLSLAGLRAPSSNLEQDPWSNNTLQNLLGGFSGFSGVLGEGRVEEVFLSYVGTYEMAYFPELMRLHADLYAASTFDELPSRTIAALREFGIELESDGTKRRWRFSSPRAVLPEIARRVNGFTESLLQDKVPEGIQTDLGRELFKAAIGATQYGVSDPSEMVRLWNEVVRRDPSRAVVPAAYQQASFDIQFAGRERSTDANSEARQKMELEKLLGSNEVRERYQTIANAWAAGFEILEKSGQLEAWFEEMKNDVLTEWGTEIDELALFLSGDPVAIDAEMARETDPDRLKKLQRKSKAASNPIGRKQLQGLLGEIREARATLTAQRADNEHFVRDFLAWVSAREALVPDAVRRVRELTAYQMLSLMPEQMRGDLRAGFMVETTATPGRIALAEQVLREYVREHYLHESQSLEHTGHEPFDREIYRMTARAWQVPLKRDEAHPLEIVAKKVLATESGQKTVSTDATRVTLTPVAGLLRTYSGAVGSSCHNKQDRGLTSGEFLRTRAWIYSTKDGRTGSSVIRGSVLGLEVMAPDGREGLVVRANNPKESWLQTISDDQIVMSVLHEAVETARRLFYERKKIAGDGPVKGQMVLVTLDASGGSSSNRPGVSNTYHRRFFNNPKQALVKSPETTFNNYDITSPAGRHPAIVLWECDEQGNEKWHGNWQP